ncbi:hypothetical protein ABID21_002747 [Pseudorhizobium tarimense]|uniref:Outer membrane beta-barrel protein n=1 Tax=Pseudorhizobium tarimense TaxID=1079109 RepID=A0ABV2H850_9HYPH|nr:outer membrane beta-barrel protein [Pseudorhizobium tarimense]MCJ8519533.1 outer membrane beta-barrel protein [Pseudorhizobium tarimense]
MRATDQQGGRPAAQRNALALLLVSSALIAPAPAVAQSPYPSQPPEETTSNFGIADASGEGTWASAPPVGIAPLRGAASATSADRSASTTGSAISEPAASAGAASADTDVPELVTGATSAGNSTPVNDSPYVEDLNQPYEDLLDPPAEDADLSDAPAAPADPTGIRLGTVLLRPSIGQSINRETIRDGSNETKRNYLGTTIRGTLTSDWSRHELSVSGETIIERNIDDGNHPRPEGQIDANLRLDLADDTVANISADYDFERQDNSDPNAVGGASTQSTVHQFSSGMTLERDAGLIRGLVGMGVNREIYGDAKLRDGSSLDLSDRDRTLVDGRLRLGYELSPALVPFVEIRGGRTFYDERQDIAGYKRSSWTYGGRGGVEFDLGEKLRGELGAGYEWVDYDDGRLATLDGIALDTRVLWSPRRGTDVELALGTTLQDATSPGASGWIEYNAAATVTHQLRHNLVGRLTGGATQREFPDAADETTWITGAGVTWSLSRYLDLTTALEYELTDRVGTDTKTLRAGLGLTLRR